MSIKVYADGHPIPSTSFVFAGGEVQVRVDNYESPEVYIEAVINSSDTLMELFMMTDAVRRWNPAVKITLEMGYVPYARQDRVMQPGEALSIKVLCDLINSQKYDRVIIWDPHSDVTPALLNNCFILSQAKTLEEQLPFGPEYHLPGHSAMGRVTYLNAFVNETILVSPDAGAVKKVGDVAKTIGFSQIVRADKTRDAKTGAITGTTVYSGHVGAKNFLIVDDICDGGKTFIELAKVLRPLTDAKIILYVTHGIFSKGLEVFKGIIDEIYCANSFGKYPDNTNLMTLV